MERTGVGTLAVVDARRRLKGLLTERDVRFVRSESPVAERMTPRERLVVHTGSDLARRRRAVMTAHKIKKLPLVNADGTVLGLITAKDLINHRGIPLPRATSGPAARRGRGGRDRRLSRAGRRGAAGGRRRARHRHRARALAASWSAPSSEIRKRLPDVELVAGNVATAEGARFLLERGVNAIKVGIGPGGGCTTRLTTNFGVPQVEALVQCRLAVGERVPLIADGGIRRDGGIAQALLFGGDTVMLGSAFAGTEETPGDIVLKSVLMPESQKVVQVPFKVFRGMASLGAVRDRLDLEEADPPASSKRSAPKGSRSACRRAARCATVMHDMLKHLCSAISYGGARTLSELRQKFWSNPERYLMRLSAASRAESFER